MYDEKNVCIYRRGFLGCTLCVFGAKSYSPEKSIENLRVADIPEDSIVVLSKEETDLSGYFHEKYAFYCLGELRLVDYYGSAFDPKDQDSSALSANVCTAGI